MPVVAPADSAVWLACHRCRAQYRVKNLFALKPRSRTACRHCGTSFVIVEMPVGPARLVEGRPPGEGPLSNAMADRRGSAESKGFIQSFTTYGEGGTLLGIHIVNVLLTLVTLGIYYFWAKVRVRRYLFSQTEFAGDRFSYHGTGAEVLRGTVKAALVFGVPYLGLSFGPQLAGMDIYTRTLSGWAAGLLLLIFIPVAIVSARRYRLSRTSWRGITLSFRGKTRDFINLWVKGYLLTGLTLGLYYPYFSAKKHAFLTTHSYFGSRSFSFQGEGKALVKSFLLPYCLTPVVMSVPVAGFLSMVSSLMKNPGDISAIPSIGATTVAGLAAAFLLLRLLWLSYGLKEQRYFWEQAGLGDASFRFSATLWPYLKLKALNLLLLLATVGLAWPWTTIRNLRFVVNHLTLVGPQNFDDVVQDYDGAPPTGEGLDGFLDTGFDLA